MYIAETTNEKNGFFAGSPSLAQSVNITNSQSLQQDRQIETLQGIHQYIKIDRERYEQFMDSVAMKEKEKQINTEVSEKPLDKMTNKDGKRDSSISTEKRDQAINEYNKQKSGYGYAGSEVPSSTNNFSQKSSNTEQRLKLDIAA